MADYAIHDTTLIGTSNIIRKKEGSSALIDPADYPKRINLMGMLEEKTVSSSPIVTFSDGADAVPLKKCEITLPASLDGYSEVDVVATGKNLFNKNTVENNTWIVVNDTTTESANGFRTSGYIPVKANTKYYVSTKSSNRSAYYDQNKNGITYFSFSGGASFTCLYDGYIRITINNTIDLDTFIVNEGNEAIEYEPFGTTHTADLGRTIHGGSVDVVNGQGMDSYDKGSMSSAYLSGLNSDYIGYEASTAYFGGHPSVWVRNWNYSRAKARQSGGIGCVCNYFPISMHNTTIFSAQYRIYFDVNGKNISSVADFIAFVQNLEANNESLDIVYELNDTYTTDFTFDHVPIDSKLGNNTIWSEQGDDTEVTYRGQGTTTPILPTLVTKTITENGTYSAEDDDADGYSEVTVNVESIVKIGINSGKLNISNGEITADSAWCYTDTFDCPSGIITLDVGEGIVSDFAGIEFIYESDGSHANYWQGNNRFREVDLTNYYAPTKKARLAFKKQYLSKVLLMDFGNGKIYSPLTASQFEEPQANLLNMNNAQSEESEGSENE